MATQLVTSVSALTNEIFYKKLALDYDYSKSLLVESGLAYDGNTYNDFYDGNEIFLYSNPVTTAAAPFSVKEISKDQAIGSNRPSTSVDIPVSNFVPHYLITNLNQKPIHQMYVDGSTPTKKVMAYLEAYAESSMNSVLIERDKMLFRLLFGNRRYIPDDLEFKGYEPYYFNTKGVHNDCYAVADQVTNFRSTTFTGEQKAFSFLRELELLCNKSPVFPYHNPIGKLGPLYAIGIISFIKEYFYNIASIKNIFENFKGTVHADGTIGMTNMFTACNFTFVGVPDEFLWGWTDNGNEITDTPPISNTKLMPLLIGPRDAFVFSVPKINNKGMSINGEPVPNLRALSTPLQSKSYNSEDKKIHDALTKKFMDSDLASRNNPSQFGLNTLLLSMESLGSSYSATTANHTAKGLVLTYKTYCASGRLNPKSCVLLRTSQTLMSAVLPTSTVAMDVSMNQVVDGLKPGGQGEFTHTNGETEVIKKDEYGKTRSHSKTTLEV